MGLRMQCLSLAIRVNKNQTFVLPITRTLLPIEQAHVISIYSQSPLLCIGSFSFQSKLLPLFDKKTVSGVTGKIQTSLPVICARMCMIVPHPPPPMVVVYGIARTTVIRSVIEAVFSISCMNHVGVVHLKEGEREKKPSI